MRPKTGVPEKRLSFAARNSGNSRNTPSHSNVIVYVLGAIARTELFKKVFSRFGVVR